MPGFAPLGGLALGEIPIANTFFGQPLSTPVLVKKNTGYIQTYLFYVDFPPFGEAVIESKWHQQWSEPIVKSKIGLRTDNQTFVAIPPSPTVSFSWFDWLSEPIHIKQSENVTNHPFLFYNYQTIVSFAWFNWLTGPVRIKLGESAQEQQFLAFYPLPFPNAFDPTYTWFAWLSEPVVKSKRGLIPGDQQFNSFNPFIPIQYTARLNAFEVGGDFFSGIIYENSMPTKAYVSVVEVKTSSLGYSSIIED